MKCYCLRCGKNFSGAHSSLCVCGGTIVAEYPDKNSERVHVKKQYTYSCPKCGWSKNYPSKMATSSTCVCGTEIVESNLSSTYQVEPTTTVDMKDYPLPETVSIPTVFSYGIKPHKCPICEGRIILPAGFYSSLPGGSSLSNATAEKCRSCNGTGIIWG